MMCAEGGEEGFDKEPFPSASQRINFDPFRYMGGIAWGSFQMTRPAIPSGNGKMLSPLPSFNVLFRFPLTLLQLRESWF